MKRLISYILAFALLLSLPGCKNDKDSSIPQEPLIDSGSLLSERLTVDEQNYERASRTGGGRFLETASGYYYEESRYLYYADKADLNNWVLVCSDPECAHYDPLDNCGADVGAVRYMNGRIGFLSSVSDYPELYLNADGRDGKMLCSMVADGTDVKLEQICDETLCDPGSAFNAVLFSDAHVVAASRFLQDGSYMTQFYYVDAEGGHKVFEEQTNSMAMFGTYSAKRTLGINGDAAFVSDYFGGYTVLCWIHDGELITTDISEMSVSGSYLSGNTLRCLKANDGYYDINLLTGEEKKLADPQLENSMAVILQANCIIEYTQLADGQAREMRFFDGKTWHAVMMHDDLQTRRFSVLALTTDSILFACKADNGYRNIYRLALDPEEYRLEQIGAFDMNPEINAGLVKSN